MTTTDKPSIAELMQAVASGTSYTRDFLALQDAAPALLDIVAAALAVRGQERLAARGAGQPGDLKRMRDVYEDALDKVMP